MFSFLLLFLAGVILDVLWAMLVLAIDKGYPWTAAALQFGFTVLGVGATWAAISLSSVPGLLGYALGGAVGTWFVVKHRERECARGSGRSGDRQCEAFESAAGAATSGGQKDQ